MRSDNLQTEEKAHVKLIIFIMFLTVYKANNNVSFHLTD